MLTTDDIWVVGELHVDEARAVAAKIINDEFEKDPIKPMGLHNLYNLCYVNPRILSSTYGFSEFITYVRNLQKYEVYLSPGKKGKLYNLNLVKFTNEFIKSVTKFNYYAVPHFTRVNFNLENKIKYKLGLKFKKKNFELKLTNVIIPKNEKVFIRNSKKYIENKSKLKIQSSEYK